MVFAVIDLGTNTFNLLIAEKQADNTFKKLFKTKIPVKLGEGSINLGFISAIPFQRGIEALQTYEGYLNKYKVQQTFAFATSAIRSASNGRDFVEQAREHTAIDITIIDGSEEAELIYHGNKMAVKMDEKISLIMDIGGGSTEFILANNNTIFWKESYLLGAARLLEKFRPSDPITSSEINEFNDYLRQKLHTLFEAIRSFKPESLIGSSGAFDSIVDMIGEEFNTITLDELLTEYPIELSKYIYVSNKIKKSTLKERREIKGLIDMRVDMIVISVLLIDFILTELKLKNIRVSTFSLKEGVISQKLGLSLS